MKRFLLPRKASDMLIMSGLTLFFLATMACSKNGENTDDALDPDLETGLPPVEAGDPNTTYNPAFTGQTRVQGARTEANYQSIAITSALNAPWGIDVLPDGHFLITEKGGTLRIVTNAGEVGNPITGVPTVNSGGQGGLLGVTIDPQFVTNRMIYWVFSENVTGGTVTSVAKGRLSDNRSALEDVAIIYRNTPAVSSTGHYGGRIIFDKSGHLLVSIGDRNTMSSRQLAQRLGSSVGKIVRITTDGQSAADNPSFSAGGALSELYSIGHRNPQGMALHPVTGDLWQSEHGPRGGDEINRVQAGANYGWPTITYGIEYGGQTIGEGLQQKEGMMQPVYYWDPVISPSGITFYAGNKIPEWQNNLFVAALSGTHIARLIIGNNNRVIAEERLLQSEGQRFRDITQGIDGALYAVTDGGRLYRIGN